MYARALLRGRRGGRGGFTLIEVLVAMVILAIGLLALQAMAIGASRTVVRADRQGEFTAIATTELETSLARFRRGQNVTNDSYDIGRATVTRLVTPFGPVALNNGAGSLRGIMVEIQVRPRAGFNNLNFTPVIVVGRATIS